MRIAQIAPLHETVPPKLYGGTERIVAYLTDALIEQGHDVTLFASAEAGTRALQIACRNRPLRLDPALKSDLAAHLSMLDQLRERADQFDILHFHIDLLHMPMFRDLAERTVTTLHGRLDINDLGPFYARHPEYRLVSISHDQRRPLPHMNWIATVHHGVPAESLPFTAQPAGGYLAFLGRIAPEKRPDRAIAIAKRAGIRLKIAAKVDPADRDYFKKEIEPLLGHPLIEYIGEIGDAGKGGFLGNARALLFPIDWPEPFGLVMIEAMACGTPVIAYRRGSVPELVEDGVSGLIVDDLDAAVAAVRRIGELDRRAIRRSFERRFTAQVMARNYLRVYEEVLKPLPRTLLAAASPEMAEPRLLELGS